MEVRSVVMDPTDSAARGASVSRRPDIQGLRAIAVLMVVAFHAGLPVPGGFVGVDVFFVISGFVITAMLHREWTSTGRIRFGSFYLKRFKRLAPALALMLTVTLLISALVQTTLRPRESTPTLQLEPRFSSPISSLQKKVDTSLTIMKPTHCSTPGLCP